MKHWLLPGSLSCWLITTGIGQHTTWGTEHVKRFNEPTVDSRSAMVTQLPDRIHVYTSMYLFIYITAVM